MLFRILYWLNVALFGLLIFFSFAGLAKNAQVKTDLSTGLLIVAMCCVVLIGAAVLNARGSRAAANLLLGIPLALFAYVVIV